MFAEKQSVLYAMPHLTIRWDEDRELIHMEWRSFAGGFDFRKGVEHGLAMIREKRARYWLSDLRGLGVIGKNDQRWCCEEWYPRARAHGIKLMALVVCEYDLVTMKAYRMMRNTNCPDFAARYFTDLPDAYTWIDGHLTVQ